MAKRPSEKWGRRKSKEDYNNYMRKYMCEYHKRKYVKEKTKAYYNVPKNRKRQWAYLKEYMHKHPKYSKTENQKIARKLNKHKRRLRIRETKTITSTDWLRIKNASPLCSMCGRFVGCENLTVDHIVPLSKGGTHSTDNIQALCFNCNSHKRVTFRKCSD